MPHQLSDPMIDDVCALFSALGDASRLKVLRVLLDAGAPVSQGVVARKAGLNQANASKHLSCLVRSGLARRDPAGNLAYFSLVQPLVTRLCNLVCGHVSVRARTTYQALR